MADITTMIQSVPSKMKDLGDGSFAPNTTETHAPASEDNVAGVTKVEQRFTYVRLNALATTIIKGGSGFLHALAINTKGATGNTVTLYDNTAGSGAVIGVIDTTTGDGKLYDITFTTGLTAVVAGGTSADLTVSYR
ncbi:MAG TPA: hypothetical protein VJ841_03585 [Candidatus Saccharimonadales bacterium]|nr:hypothetical protein [Candidatus Saccharimonadales bacterium]